MCARRPDYKSIQVKLKQQDDAARALYDLGKDNDAAAREENARLAAQIEEFKAENARLLAELELLRAGKPNSRRWINTSAVEWALDQELPAGMKLVLVTFAAHCDEHGESWPSVKRIAKKSKMVRETVRDAITSLNAKKLLIDTGRRGGTTNQVKIYRCALERVAVTTPFIQDQSGGKGVAVTTPLKGESKGSQRAVKGAVKGAVVTTTNKEQWNNGTKKKEKGAGTVPSTGTGKGFVKELVLQASEAPSVFEGKHQQPDYVAGWDLDGKFLSQEEAERMGKANPKLLDEGRFRRARKGHDGKIVIISEPKR